MLMITNIDEFRKQIAHKEEIRENDLGRGLTSFCYMIAGDGTFDNFEARECRGIVFKDGKVVGRPIHKFFNVNERKSTRVENLDWSKVVRVMDKRDGSMIHTAIERYAETSAYSGLTPKKPFVWLKSKKSFESDVARAAWFWLLRNDNVRAMIDYITAVDCTLIFEWTAPDARIVLYYPEAEL